MELQLTDGIVLSGTVVEMQEFLDLHLRKQEQSVCPPLASRPEPVTEELGMRSWKETNIYPFYTSSHHGHMLISDMHEIHIKNAILKMHREDTHLDRPREFEGLVETLVARLVDCKKSCANAENEKEYYA